MLTNCKDYQRPGVRPKKYAEMRGVHYNTVRNWAVNGKIEVIWLPYNRFLVAQCEVDRLKDGTPDPETAQGSTDNTARAAKQIIADCEHNPQKEAL